jgi:hypothetical protein
MTSSPADSIISDPATLESRYRGIPIVPFNTTATTNRRPRDQKSESNPLYSETETEPVRRWRKRAKTAHVLQPEWGQPARKPYHEYVHQLLGAGWANLQDLDEYMSDRPAPTEPFVVSVLDILDDFKLKQWPDLNNEHDLSSFTKDQSREGVNVRLYMAGYSSRPSAGMIEAFGSSFGLDPRFFNWAIDSKNHVFTPAQRHRAPYIRIGFGVLDRMTHSKTDTERFKVLVYIQVSNIHTVYDCSLTSTRARRTRYWMDW